MSDPLAQVNNLRFRLLMAHLVNAGFGRSPDRLNATAEACPGFVWRPMVRRPSRARTVFTTTTRGRSA